MDWLFGHLNLLVVAGALIASWLANRNKKNSRKFDSASSEESIPPPSESTNPPAVQRPEFGDEARRVQEEIRRKIAERIARRLVPLSSTGRSAPVAAPNPPELPAVRAEVARGELMQAELAGRAEQRRQRADLRETAAASAVEEPSSSYEVNTWTGGLRDPESLRRAVILSEILGKPVALR